jgi:triacylglycerol lipase
MKNRVFSLVLIAFAIFFLMAKPGFAYGPSLRKDAVPVVFVHGEGDSANYWQDMVWRFESNGWPRHLLFALQQPYPLAREPDAEMQPGRSSDAEHLEFLKEQVNQVLATTGAKQVILFGHGRGSYAIRNYLLNAGGDQTVSHAVLSWPDGPWPGARGKLTLSDYDSAALKGVKTLLFSRVEQLDGAFSVAQFEESFRFITGQTPKSPAIWPQFELVLNGLVTGMGFAPGERASPGSHFYNNLPVPKATVEVYAVELGTGLRIGSAVYKKAVGADGRWGPFLAEQGTAYEFVVKAPSYAVTHIYRSPFSRGSNLVHLKAGRIADADLPAFSIVEMRRTRGFLHPGLNHLAFDGQTPPPGVPVTFMATVNTSKITLNKWQNRAIAAEIHTDTIDRVVGRTWPAKESHVVVLELTQ